MMSRRSQIVRACLASHAKRRLRGNQNVVAPSGNGLAQNCFGEPVGVNIGRIKKIDAAFETNVDEASCLGHIASAPGFKKIVPTTKRSRAITQHRYLQTRASQSSKFHAE